MSGFMDWKYLNEGQISRLEQSSSEAEIKKLLTSAFEIHTYPVKKQSILCTYHFFNYAFCKEKAFNSRKVSTFMSIMNDIMLKDATVNSSMRTMDGRFDYFQELLIKHSVQRPPQSVQIFLPAEVEAILDYAIERKFRLYQYIFDTMFVVTLKQVSPNMVESPKVPLSLADGQQLLTSADTSEGDKMET